MASKPEKAIRIRNRVAPQAARIARAPLHVCTRRGTCTQEDDLVIKGQLTEVRDSLGPFHQGEELLVCGVADVGHRVMGLKHKLLRHFGSFTHERRRSQNLIAGGETIPTCATLEPRIFNFLKTDGQWQRCFY